MSITTPHYRKPEQKWGGNGLPPRRRHYAMTCVLAFLTLSETSHLAYAEGTQIEPTSGQYVSVGASRKVTPYKLESVEIKGSSRLTTRQLTAELGLVPGLALDDQFVMTARSRILGLGLFKSVILLMRRGDKPEHAKLIIEVEDDPSVLGDWAIGGELGVTVAEDNAYATLNAAQVPMDYRLGLVARNALQDLHRASITADVDYTGTLRAGQIAYGLPRFTKEAAQFDAEISVSDPTFRYLDTLGFGGRGQGLWSLNLDALPGDLQYGAAMYVNNGPRFAMRGYPGAVAGPKFAYYQETRLRRFFFTSGHRLGASVLVLPEDPSQSIYELSLAKTAEWAPWLYFTASADGLTVGPKGVGLRAETRWDIPFGSGSKEGEQAGVFLRLRLGQDHIGPYKLVGSSAVAGVRYHSPGFIAEVAFRITNAPPELLPTRLPGNWGVGE